MRILGNLWMDVALVVVLTVLIYMLTAGLYLLKKRMKISIIWLRGLFIAAVAGAIAYQVLNGYGDAPNFRIFDSVRRISELGYKAVWNQLLYQAGLFAIAGILLPLGHQKVNRFSRAILYAASISVLLSAIRFAFGSYQADETIYSFLGCLLGYSLTAFVAGMFTKLPFLKRIKFSTRTYVIGVFYMMAFSFFGIGLIILDNGSISGIVTLKLPVPDERLPNEMSISAALSNDQEKVDIYEMIETNVSEDTARIAAIIGIQGEVQLQGSNNTYAIVEDGDKKLTLYIAGNWRYEDSVAQSADGELPTDEEVEEIAREIALNGAARDYEMYSVSIDLITDAEGNPLYKEAYVIGAVGGHRVVGSCEFTICVGAEGIIISVDKHDADFKQFKTAKTISSQTAYDLVVQSASSTEEMSVTVSHNLYSGAESVQIDTAGIEYWLEEVNGMLLPIWSFRGTALLEDGTTKDFAAYVPAMK